MDPILIIILIIVLLTLITVIYYFTVSSKNNDKNVVNYHYPYHYPHNRILNWNNDSPYFKGGCAGTRFGCCPDGKTSRFDNNGSNCPV